MLRARIKGLEIFVRGILHQTKVRLINHFYRKRKKIISSALLGKRAEVGEAESILTAHKNMYLGQTQFLV